MKKIIVITALIFGMMPMIAQEDYVSELPTESSTYTSASKTTLNQDYLNTVQALETPEKAAHLQKLVAAWNPTKETNNLKRKKTLSAVATSNSSKIQATYNAQGALIATQEVYKNVALPLTIRKKVFSKYSGWEQVKNKYKVCYTEGQLLEAVYVVVLKQNGKRKTLKVDVEGRLL